MAEPDGVLAHPEDGLASLEALYRDVHAHPELETGVQAITVAALDALA